MTSRASGSLAVRSRSSISPSSGRNASDPNDLAVNFGGQGGLGQPGADLGGDVDRSNAA